ncbi:SMC family ATPase [Anaerolineales bacterium HSG6]|nr:SMC family ATPase [Anaerolineales bacterium HSG6]
MIPLNLKLRNFMAYQDAELDFQGFHLAALTGSNGAGKSSLLDAITWALWGKARARDDALIHLGAEQMEVEYTFGLHGNTHRVIRKRTSKGRGRSTLSFQAETESGWRTLSDNVIRGTQLKINQLMRLDYETFTNSAFLLQGQADVFTTKSAGQRKEILSDILGLDIYDTYAERAKTRAKTAKTEVAVHEAKIKQIDEELAQRSTHRQSLKEAEAKVTTLSQAREQAETDERLYSAEHQAISEKQRQLEELQRRLKHGQADLGYVQQTVAQVQVAIEQYQAILARQTEIESGLAELQSAKSAVTDWEARLQQMSNLSNRKHGLERQLDSARSQLEVTLRGVTTKIGILTPKAGAVDTLRHQLQGLQTQLDRLKAVELTHKSKLQQSRQLDTELARLTEQQNQIIGEGQTLKEKLAELEQAGSHCPVCKTPLDEKHRTQASNQFLQEIESKRDVYRRNGSRIKQLEVQQNKASKSMVEADQQLQNMPMLQGELGRLKQSLIEAEQAGTDLVNLRAEQQNLQTQLDSLSFAQAVRQELAQITATLATVNYDQQAHQQAKEQVTTLYPFEQEARNLADATARLPQEEARLVQERGRLERLKTQTETDQQRIATLQLETANLPELRQKLQQAQTSLARLQGEERQARDMVAATRQQLDYLATLAERRKEQASALKQVSKALGIYQTLQVAFGKKGVQALLIESAIPEIEQEANRLLGRMSDGRMNLKFETQRATKKGDSIIETLDIRISDELGTRDYDLFSGGEAFRINFAIRIAISKVLARRAGAQLQTLIIDEGFGSQDGLGRERLVEAINGIQEDFQKVLVITHVEELKDAFPHRIEVEKRENGSQLIVR